MINILTGIVSDFAKTPHMADVIARGNADQSGDGAVVDINPCPTDSAVAHRNINLLSDVLMRFWILSRALLIVVQQQEKFIFVDDAIEFSMHAATTMSRFDDAGVTIELIEMAAQAALVLELAISLHQIMHRQCKFLP